MNDKYYFFYDESEHSRSITKETITADNFSNDFIDSPFKTKALISLLSSCSNFLIMLLPKKPFAPVII